MIVVIVIVIIVIVVAVAFDKVIKERRRKEFRIQLDK